MIITTYSAEQRLERSALNIMREPAFCMWGGLLLIGKRIVVDDPQITTTAKVDMLGNTYYYRGFIDSLPLVNNRDVHVNFVVLHETGHKACMHLIRGLALFKQNAKKANAAADHVVNLLILECDPMEAFAKTLYDKHGNNMFYRDTKYAGMSLHEVYRLLPDDPSQDDGSKTKGGKGSGGKMIVDDHDFNFVDDGSDFEQAKEEVEKVMQEIEQALRTGGYLASKLGNAKAHRMAGGLLESQVRWQDELAEFLTDICTGDEEVTWRRPNRRFVGEDMYFPSTYTESLGEVVYAPDESGSVSEAEHRVMLTELVSLCKTLKPKRLRVIYWSDGITAEEVYLPHEFDTIQHVTKPRGGGGTVIKPVADYVNSLSDVQCAVIATDGGIYGGWGNWNVPTLWCITRKHTKAPVGKTIYLKVNY